MNTWPSASPRPRLRVPVDDAGKAAVAQELRAAEAAAAVRRLEPHVGQPLVGEELHGRARVLELVAGAREVVALGRAPWRRPRPRRAAAPTRRRLVDRIEPHPPERRRRRDPRSAAAARPPRPRPRSWRESGSRAAARLRLRPARGRAAGSARHRRGSCSRARAPAPARATAAARSTFASDAFSVQYACLTAATVCTTASRKRSSELSWLRFAMTYCCRAASMARSFSSGCENAT